MAGENKGLGRRDSCVRRESSLNEDFLQRTIRVWQPYSTKPLTEEDAREITANMVALVRYLERLDCEYKKAE